MNKVILMGRVGKDPESRDFGQGGQACNFSVATNETWKDKSGVKQEKTTWHKVVCYGKLAGICQEYVKKGKQILIEGKINTRSYDKEGAKVYITEVNADEVKFL